MLKVTNLRGLPKKVFNIIVEITLVVYFLPSLFTQILSWRTYILLLKRLLYFFNTLQHNKFVTLGQLTRVDLYVPGFPSRAFFTAAEKFKTFGQKLPGTTVLISLSSACRFHCEHCYQQKDKGKDIDLAFLIPVIKNLQNRGVAFFNLEGGEPFLVYPRLKQICSVIDRRSEIWVNSTGDGITLERLRELKAHNLTAVMFSMHTPIPEKLNQFMHSEEAWDTLERGINTCHQAKIPIALNMCLGKEDFYNGIFIQAMIKAKEFNAALVQLIKPKPAGGWLESGADTFSKRDIQRVKDLVRVYNHDEKYHHFPAISAQIIEEDKTMFGCTAGGTDRFYINAKGDVQPCEFLNISFGNIGEEDFDNIYERMRKQFLSPGDCWLCEAYAAQIVQIMKEKGLKVLPLDKEDSQAVYKHWHLGNKTELYKMMEEIYR